MPQHLGLGRGLAALLSSVVLVGCASHPPAPRALGLGADAPSVLAPASGPAVRPLAGAPLRPDVMVTGRLTPRELHAVATLVPTAVAYATGTVRIGAAVVQVASVDPSTFRRYAARATAESNPVWQTVAAGQLIASHALAQRLHLPLGGQVVVTGSRSAILRVGGFATTGIPGTDLVVDIATGRQLGVGSAHAVVLSAGRTDPTALASKVRHVIGPGADVELLTPPPDNPIAFLTGGRAARALGAFSYRYYPDGTIVPDARWVGENIVTTRVPILGYVTCHRLMIPQLTGALREVQREGLASKIRTYDGCYVPRFMEHDPSHPVSLHTWGIAIDLDAATNQRGTRGTQDPRVVAIFKSWGFRWGGDWSWTDPMHFELGALLRTSR